MLNSLETGGCSDDAVISSWLIFNNEEASLKECHSESDCLRNSSLILVIVSGSRINMCVDIVRTITRLQRVEIRVSVGNI